MDPSSSSRERQALLDDWAEVVCDNVTLRDMLRKWHDLFSPVVQPGTSVASLVDMTRDTLDSSIRYSMDTRADR